jgi:hypothetical protein
VGERELGARATPDFDRVYAPDELDQFAAGLVANRGVPFDRFETSTFAHLSRHGLSARLWTRPDGRLSFRGVDTSAVPAPPLPKATPNEVVDFFRAHGLGVKVTESGSPAGVAQSYRIDIRIPRPVVRTYLVPGQAARPREARRTAPRRRRGSRRITARARSPGDDEPPDDPEHHLALWHHPRWGSCTPNLLRLLLREGRS